MTCAKCGQPATHRFSFDPDIQPIDSCSNCRDEVKLNIHLLMGLGGDELAKQAEQQFEKWRRQT